MMNVVYDFQIFSLQRYGGISRYICEVASRIRQATAWHARIVAPVHFNRYLADSSVTTYGLYIPNPHRRLARLYRWTNSIAAPSIIASSGPDLIHQTYYDIQRRVPDIPVVVTVHDMIHELYPQRFARSDPTPDRKRASVMAADHLLCVSHSTAKDLMDILGVPGSKITVTHLGFSEVFSRTHQSANDADAPTSKPYLLYVGERGSYKNFDRLLQAYASSAALRSNLDLMVFGGGPLTKMESLRIKALGIPRDAVRRVPGDDTELARCYASAQAFVYPSEYEGFGMPPLEAMSSGCPVVCSRGSSISEVVGTAGEFFDPTCVDSIRVALEAVALSDSRRRELIEAGRVQCRRFSWERCAAETLAAYRSVIGTPEG